MFIGLYEQQDPNQREFNLRGKFTTNDQGQYALYGIRPVPYPVSETVTRLHFLWYRSTL